MASFPPRLEDDLDDYKVWIQGGRSPEKAYQRLCGQLSTEDADLILEEHARRTRRFIEITDPRVLHDQPYIQTWYPGPDFPTAWCWPAYKRDLARRIPDPEVVQSIDDSSTKIMASLPHPYSGVINTRGLVLGYVQSGKTANYSALIAKAADIGYRLFIVLAGMTSILRRQTQGRLWRDVCAPVKSNWHTLTGFDADFQASSNADAMLNPKNRDTRLLCAVKKNTHILKRLHDYLSEASREVLENCPAIIIDDECDQASVNTRKKADRRSRINARIIELLDCLPKAVYLGYTATPFANLFIDPEPVKDLYPRDFIFDLGRPKRYFGAERIFGRELLEHEEGGGAKLDGMDVIREVNDPEDTRLLRPPSASARFDFKPQLPETLHEALQYFLLATACRYARGHDDHSTMLVHTTYFTVTHSQLQALIEAYVDGLAAAWRQGDASFQRTLEARWIDETSKVPADSLDPPLLPVSFSELASHLETVFTRCRVVVDNGELGSGLDYDRTTDRDPRVFVAIGGNTLSRGLTLDGLVTSYFVRGASAYDTLLQMGRWFGFHLDYEDLPRIWMTEELEKDFMHLAMVEEEIRRDIRRYERQQLSPSEFAVRVQCHSKLSITSKLKMGNSRVTHASYSDRREQTFLFDHRNASVLRSNIDAARRLLNAAHADGLGPTQPKSGASYRALFAGVPAQYVIEFIKEYSFHPEHEELESAKLVYYIQEERRGGSLERWNIVVVARGTPDSGLGSIDLGPGPLRGIGCINRSRYRRTEPANIKALTSRPDRVADLDFAGSRSEMTDADFVEKRNALARGIGLLLLYPISKDSFPERGKGERHPLEAAEHVIGVALVFPESVRDQKTYVANNLPRLLSGQDQPLDSEEDVDVEAQEERLEAAAEGTDELEG